VSAQPGRRVSGDQATSDLTAFVPTPTTTTRVTAREISELLADLGGLRVGAPGDDPALRARFLARKADLLARIADAHTHPDTDPASAEPEGHTP
jgi:hypothetical protein